MKVGIKVNGNYIKAEAGETVLNVLNEHGIKVPTLCHLKNMFPTGSCRMCVVEHKNTNRLITSCSAPVEDGMEIYTHSPRVTEARKMITELLLSNHPDDCLYCVRNGNCELQKLSEELCINEKRIKGKKNKLPLDVSSTSIIRDPEKCILCGRCVRVCEEVMGVACIDFNRRGSSTVVSTAFNKGMNTSSCVNCGQCIMVCPTGALTEQNHFGEIKQALVDEKKTVVVQYAPSISVSIAEELGMKPGKDITGIMNAALRKIGFDYVFDTSFAADLTIMEESAELIGRIANNKNLPLITSCCPAWVKYAEEFFPEMLPLVSTCKSPQQMAGAVIKSYFADSKGINKEDVYSVSIMPCTAKKFEAQREEMTRKGISDVDAVLTTREFVKFIRLFGVNIHELEPETSDNPMGIRSTAGKIFGNSGGVAEAAIRTAHYKLTGKELVKFKIPGIRGLKGRKETILDVDGLHIGVAVVNGLANARELLLEVKAGRKDIHFIEVMACPGGCVGGGGQPVNLDEKAVRQRAKTLYRIDDEESIKVSHKNPDIIRLYQDFLDEPGGEKSHDLLHTSYKAREVEK
ncbi:MAG: NADH-dependent [FeFe] hydrogenase, group A6 [Bacteroidales bacterium]|jgi:NADH-quinone oxidoreductase subunit G/NADP-reducing hydrogenase subunit HndD|nr:NADH-dependent [FeFe] hydrogenase, group A6 [Bacteroidales bacterium]